LNSLDGVVQTTRAQLAAQLERWRAGALDAASLKRWVESVPDGEDEVAREALAELDLLEVHLLTTDDVPALRALLQSGDLATWNSYRRGIDLDARSKRLKRDPLYRPFCR
jgi:hypothetical protein